MTAASLILCWRRIRKFDENKQTNRQTENRHTENSKPEATLIPVDCQGERANSNHTKKTTLSLKVKNRYKKGQFKKLLKQNPLKRLPVKKQRGLNGHLPPAP